MVHYFFPAERNPLVEIVPAEATDPACTDRLMAFYEAIGKVPIRVGSRYGYAVDPVFEGLFLAAALAVEAGLGTIREVDAAARRALGLGVGPFTAMNLTGGNPITAHALDVMTQKIGPWFRVPRLLREAMASQQPWPVAQRGDPSICPRNRKVPSRTRCGVPTSAWSARSSTAGSSPSPISRWRSSSVSRCAPRSPS